MGVCLSFRFGRRGRCCGVGFFFGWAAIEAHKHGRAQDAFEGTVAAGFVNAAFDAAHGVSGTS